MYGELAASSFHPCSMNVSPGEMADTSPQPSNHGYQALNQRLAAWELSAAPTVSELPRQIQSTLELSADSMDPEPSKQASLRFETPTGSSLSQPLNIDEPSVVPFHKPIELETCEQQSQAPPAVWDFDWAAYQSPVHTIGASNSSTVPNFPELHEDVHVSSGSPEATALPHSKVREYQSPLGLASGHPIIPALARNIQRRRDSVVTLYCHRIISPESQCSCICHKNHHYRSPSLLNKLIGSLFVGYTGLPILTTKCDSSTCVNQTRSPRSIRASYTFPTWFVTKTLDLAIESSITSGPSFGLSLRNRVNLDSGMNIISGACNGDIPMIIKLLEQHKASLTDIYARAGQSAFYVCI